MKEKQVTQGSDKSKRSPEYQLIGSQEQNYEVESTGRRGQKDWRNTQNSTSREGEDDWTVGSRRSDSKKRYLEEVHAKI